MPLCAAPVRPAHLASQAMRDEVSLSPKPGLVDRIDSGAHSDMDLPLFLKSIDAIAPFLAMMERMTPRDGASEKVLPLIRPVGVRAEAAMFEATGGINTHRGQIFCMGVCTAAAVRKPGSPRDILDEAGRICRGITGELTKTAGCARSHGERAFRRYGSTGIRGEAEKGFPSVANCGLPAFSTSLLAGFNREEASLEALLHLMAVVEDSTVLHRRGMQGLSLMRREAETFLYNGGMSQDGAYAKLVEMNRFFIHENISPGGCADLLALTLFTASLEEL